MINKLTINLFNRRITLLYLLIFLIVLARSVLMLDPDFGWHLRMGEIIMNSGLPLTDPFSFTMPSYRFINHEWLIDAVTFLIYLKQPFILSILYTLILLFTLMITASQMKRTLKEKKVFALLLFWTASITLAYQGVRPQVLSWLYMTILFKLLKDVKSWYRYAFFTPLLFLLWVNTHGSFSAGLIVLALFIVVKSVTTKIFHRKDFLVVLLSLFSSLINPYGIRIWKEVITTANDSSIRWWIAEWHPAITQLHLSFFILVSISVILFIKNWSTTKPEQSVIYLFLLVQAFSSVRFIPYWILFSIPLLYEQIMQLEKDTSKIKYGLERFNLSLKIFSTALVVVFVYETIFNIYLAYNLTEDNYYPLKASEYLKQSAAKRVFAPYGWGGYLIWKVPDAKYYIDGRMPSWRNHEVKGESEYAMKTYVEILRDKTDLMEELNKYDVDTIVWEKNQPTKIMQISIKGVNFLREKGFDPGEKLSNNWELIYEDEKTVVYQRM